MSGLEVDLVPEGTNGPQGSSPITRQTVEVVFDTAKPTNGAPANPNADAGIGGRIARGVAALQKAGGGVGRVPSAASEAAGTPSEPAKAGNGLDVAVEGAETGSEGADQAADGAETPEIDAAAADGAASAPEIEELRSNYALAQARIDDLTSGFTDDAEPMAWVEKPVDDLRAYYARKLGQKPDSVAVEQALTSAQWELTLDRMAVAKEALPKDIKDRNDGEHAERRKALAKIVADAGGAAKQMREGRESDRSAIGKAFEAAPDKYPYAAVGAEIQLGGMNGGDAAVFLWKQAIDKGEIKNAGTPEKNAAEALRLYDKFCKTRLGTKLQLQNATPSPANTPAASKEAATGAKKSPTVSSKQAASAPAAKKTTTTASAAPTGPRVIDVSDMAGRNRRIAAVSRKFFGK